MQFAVDMIQNFAIICLGISNILQSFHMSRNGL